MTRALSTKRPARGGLSPIVLRFAEEMQSRLDRSGRSRYQNLSFSVLVEGASRNATDLCNALMDRADTGSEDVTQCAADLANYAMFIGINNIFNAD